MNESEWTRKLDKTFTAMGGYTIPIVGGMRGKNGVADRYWIHKRWAGWIEFKSDTRRMEALQVAFLKEVWQRQPGTAFVVRRGEGSGIGRVYAGCDLSLKDLRLVDTIYKVVPNLDQATKLSVEELVSMLEIKALHPPK